EEEKRLAAAPLLAHEDERRRWCKELDGRQRLYFALVGKAQQPLAQRAVADLVVILQEVDEARRSQLARLLAARLLGEGRHLALIGEALGQAAREMAHRRIHITDVVAIRLAGRRDVIGVMRVVVPLRVVLAGTD